MDVRAVHGPSSSPANTDSAVCGGQSSHDRVIRNIHTPLSAARNEWHVRAMWPCGRRTTVIAMAHTRCKAGSVTIRYAPSITPDKRCSCSVQGPRA